MVDGARDGNKLMLRTGLTRLFQLFYARVNDVFVTKRCQRHAAAEPILLLQFKDFFEEYLRPRSSVKASSISDGAT